MDKCAKRNQEIRRTVNAAVSAKYTDECAAERAAVVIQLEESAREIATRVES